MKPSPNKYFLFIKSILFFSMITTAVLTAQELKPADKYMLASAFEQSGDFVKAKGIFYELLADFPTDNNYFTSLNRIYLKLKEYQASIGLIEKKITENKTDFNFYGLLGNTYYAKGEIENAYKAWDRGINVSPKSIVPYRTICSYAIQNRAYEKALGYYKRGEEELGKKGAFTGEIFNLYTVLNRNREAVEYLCDVLQSQPESIGIGKSVFYTLSYRAQITDEFKDIIKKYISSTGKQEYKELLAFIYMLNGENIKAVELIKEIDSTIKNGNLVYNFGMESFGYRNYETAALALEYINENYPKAPFYLQSRIYYPKSLELSLNKNKPEKWKTEIIPDTSDWQGYRKAISAYNETAKLFPHTENQSEAYLRTGLIRKEIFRDYARASEEFEKVIANNIYTPTRGTAILNLAEIKVQNGLFNDAEKLLTDYLNSPWADSVSKKSASFLLGKGYFRQGRFKEAVENLDEAAYDFGSDLSNDAIELSALINSCRNDSLSLLEYARADMLIDLGEYEKGADLLKITSQSGNFFLADAARYCYASLLTSLGRYPEAIKIMEEISSLDNSNYADNAYFSLGNIYYYGMNDFRSAKSCFEKLLASFPESIFADKSRNMIKTINNKEEIKK